MNEADFVTKIREKLREIGIRERDVRSQLGALEGERHEYEAALSVWGKEMDNGATVAPEGPSELLSDQELAGKSIAEGAELVMERFGGQMKVTDLTMILRTTNVTKAKGNGAYSSVLKTLQRKDDIFYEVERGKWGLTRMRAPAGATAPSA